MRIVLAGAHGQVARRLGRLLSARGDTVVGIIRNPAHEADVRDDGVEPAVLDLESASVDDVAAVVHGADAVVFAAGAGPGSGAERKRTVDYGAAVKLIDAGARRYVMVSAIAAGRPEDWSDAMRPYYEAKAGADERLAESGLDYTIVRPGGLTDEPGTGRVRVGTGLEYGQIPRDDVAAVLLAVLEQPSSIGKTFELVSGEDAIDTAVAGL
jgi:uncharacterized protein YbjT (DUF2867 family)